MKNILTVLLLVFVLLGCSNKSGAAISNGDEAIWSSPNKTYTKNELYQSMKSQDYTEAVISSIVKNFAQKEGIDVKAKEDEANGSYEEVIKSGYGSYIDYYYGSKEAYITQTVRSELTSELNRIKFLEKFTEMKAEYMPYKAEIAYFNTAEEAQKVIDDVNNNIGTFAYVSSENGFADAINASVYTDTSDLPIEVKEAVQNAQSNGKSGLIGPIQTSLAATETGGTTVVTPRYYVINVISINADEFKDEFVEYGITNIYTGDDILNEYMKKYNFQVYDQETYDLLKDKFPGLGTY